MQSLGLRKVLANKDVLEPIVEQTISLVHEEEFNSLAKELGFLKESCSDDKTECAAPAKVIFRWQTSFTDPKRKTNSTSAVFGRQFFVFSKSFVEKAIFDGLIFGGNFSFEKSSGTCL